MVRKTQQIKQEEINSYSRDSKMIKKKRRSQSGTGGAAGASTLSTTFDQRPKCFRDIMDLVLHLSDDEWKSVSRGMTKKVTRVDFAVACTKIVTAVSSAVVRRLLKPLSKSFGINAILEANNKLKKMAESKSSKNQATAQRSHMEVSDFICHLGQKIVIEIKGAMLEAIRITAAGPGLSCSESSSSPAEDPITQLDDLSVSCTNEICDRILALYHAEELHRTGGEPSVMSLNSIQEVRKIMKGLEKVVSTSRSSSWFTVSTTSDSVSTTTSCASSLQSESPFSDQFMSKASQAVSEVLVQTEQKLAASVSSQTSVRSSSETEPDFLRELAKSTAMEILHKVFCILVSCSEAEQSGPEHEQKCLSFAQRIHMDIHKLVFTYFCERKQAISEKSKTQSSLCTKTDAELEFNVENIRKSAAAEKFLDKATQVASDILVKRLTSHISTGLISMQGSSSGTSAQVGEAQVGDADAPYSKSSSESITVSERTPLPSVQSSPYAPLHIFTVVHNQLKAFFISFSKSANDYKRTDGLEDSESVEDWVFPIHISEEGLVHKTDIVRSFSDSVLLRRNSMLCSVHFPSELIYRFVEESTKALLQNVLNISDGSDGRSPDPAEDEEKKKTCRVHFVVKMSRQVVIKKKKKKKKKRRRVLSPDLQEASNKKSKSVFKKARKMLGRLFNISKTSTSAR